jgi:hypothetical protein
VRAAVDDGGTMQQRMHDAALARWPRRLLPKPVMKWRPICAGLPTNNFVFLGYAEYRTAVCPVTP